MILCAAWLGLNKTVAGATDSPAPITVDYPLNGSVFPPDMTAPTFQWRVPAKIAANWQIDVTFGDGAPALHVASKGERMEIGEIDASRRKDDGVHRGHDFVCVIQQRHGPAFAPGFMLQVSPDG